MLPRLLLAAGLAFAGLAAATPAAADDVCWAPPADHDEEPILPGGAKFPREVCVPTFIDIPPAP